MNYTDYAYGVSYIRAIETRLLDKGDIEGLILAKTPEEIIRTLVDKGYGSEIVSPSDYEKLLSEQLTHAWETVREVAPQGAPLNILLYQNDFHNLKVAIKAIFTGAKHYESLFLAPNTVDTNVIIKAIANQEFGQLPEMLKAAGENAYEALSATEDSQLADSIIDKASMDYAYQAAKESKSEFVEQLIALKNTLADIKIAYRSAKTDKNSAFLDRALSESSLINRESLIKAALSGADAVISYLTENGFEEEASMLKISITDFEKYSDNALYSFTDKAKYITFGVEPLIAYILKKQAELLSVRIILSGKINGFEESAIRERLRNQ